MLNTHLIRYISCSRQQPQHLFISSLTLGKRKSTSCHFCKINFSVYVNNLSFVPDGSEIMSRMLIERIANCNFREPKFNPPLHTLYLFFPFYRPLPSLSFPLSFSSSPCPYSLLVHFLFLSLFCLLLSSSDSLHVGSDNSRAD